MTNPLVEAACCYAAWGIPVLPLHHPTASICSCGRDDCPSPGKHPRSTHGLTDATTDPEIIRAWWRRWPHANIGLATGTPGGIVVLDIDAIRAYVALLNKHAEPSPLTRTIKTGRGHQQWYETPVGEVVRNSAGQLGEGIDVRGCGGYVVAPPSMHANGQRYRVVRDVQPLPVPDWLLALIVPPPRSSVPAMPARPPCDGNGTPYGLTALRAECDAVRAAAEGMRNHRLNAAAFASGQLAAGGELSEACAVAELNAAAIACGLSMHETARTITSGMRAGMESPRCAPERGAA
jgi:hypothetical protein